MALHESTALLLCNDASLIEAIRGVVASIGDLRLEVVATAGKAIRPLGRSDVVFALVHLPEACSTEEALRLLRVISEGERHLPLAVIADCYRAEDGLKIMGAGGLDYLGRPLDLKRLGCLMDMLTVGSRIVRASQSAEAPEPVEAVQCSEPSEVVLRMLGRDVNKIRRIASGSNTIFLTGETGAGKTRLAHLVHEQSPRRDEPFMAVHCGAVSANLLESELFGHVSGAFTGASRNRIGKLAEAGNGTLLLDDIDTLPLEVQAKLLRVIDERVFEPVGSNTTTPFTARLIIATNRDLEEDVAQGRFRADLYYRINVVEIHLTPLREQKQAILPLAKHFSASCATVEGERVTGIAPEAAQVLEAYSWPGNVRELRNVIERAVALCSSREIQLRDLPYKLRKDFAICPADLPRWENEGDADEPPMLVRTKEEAEVRCIEDALAKHRNNRLRAAAELGISRGTLYNKLHRYGLAVR